MSANLIKEAGVRVSSPKDEDNGKVHYELFIKSTNDVLLRSASYMSLSTLLVRGSSTRRKTLRQMSSDRALQHNVKFARVENGKIVL